MKRMITEDDIQNLVAEAVRKASAELLKRVIKINQDAISRASFRVAIHNLIVELEGKGQKA